MARLGRSQPFKPLIQAFRLVGGQVRQTILGVSRITVTTTKTILGVARITATATKTIQGLARITATTTKTIQGLARVTATTTKTILGLSRITATTLQTILGKARITATTAKTILGKATIIAGATQTILGKARITATATQTILGKADILKATTKTIQGLSRVTVTVAATILGKARVTASTLKTVLGLARITATVSQTITGLANIINASSASYRKNAPLYYEIGGGLSMMLGDPRLPTWNTAGRPTSPQTGRFGLNTTTGKIEWYTGTAWADVVRSDGDTMTGALNIEDLILLGEDGFPLIYLQGTVENTGSTTLVQINTNVEHSTNSGLTTGHYISPTVSLIGSGNHALVYGSFIQPNVEVASGKTVSLLYSQVLNAPSYLGPGAVTTAATLVILDAPNFATNNYATLDNSTGLWSLGQGSFEIGVYDSGTRYGIRKYNGVETRGQGVVTICDDNRVTGNTTANGGLGLFTVGATDGSFIICANVNVTASTTHSFSVKVDYKDETNTARTAIIPFAKLNGQIIQAIANTDGVGPYSGLNVTIRAKAGTDITVETTGTFTSVTYNVGATISQIS